MTRLLFEYRNKDISFLKTVEPNYGKTILYGLSTTYGIGYSRAQVICQNLGLSVAARIKELKERDMITINTFIESNFITSMNLSKVIKNRINFLKTLNCYRGKRHSLGLPVRGQRTHTNARSFKLVNKLIKSSKAKKKTN